MNYSISEYPLVIDPVVASIEVHVAFEMPPDQPGAGKGGWRQFVRLTIEGADGHHGLPFVPTAAKVHIFGDEPTLASSRLLLVYGHRGGINCLLHLTTFTLVFTRQDDDFVVFTNLIHHDPLHHFWSKRHNFHKAFSTQFTRYWPENTSADWLKLCI